MRNLKVQIALVGFLAYAASACGGVPVVARLPNVVSLDNEIVTVCHAILRSALRLFFS